MADRPDEAQQDDILDLDWADLDDTEADSRPRDRVSAPTTGQDAARDDQLPGQGSLPMVSGGTCPRCGYALRPLEDTCPRCKNAPAAERPGSTAVTPPCPAPAGEDAYLPPVARSGPSTTAVWVVVVIAAVVAVSAAIGVYLWTSPRVQAARAYREGLRLQLQGQFEEARGKYQKALELDPTMGLAAFTLGTTYLRLGDPAVVSSIQELLNQAIQGQTAELDEADRWFRHAITLGQQLPPDRKLMDGRISTPLRLKAYAHSCLALTALIRASAALQADDLDNGMSWLQVAGQEAQAALLDDPQNAAAEHILKRVSPSL